MRLSDLHRHLDGSLRRETLRELADAGSVALPDDIRFHAGMGLPAALGRFATNTLLSDVDAPTERGRVPPPGHGRRIL